MFYTYLWLREDRTPYYVGKGSGVRAYINHHGRSAVHKAPPKERIVIYPAESESDAFETETVLIWYYGRKDLGTGCLRNLTGGGENPPPGRRFKPHSRETKETISRKNKGKKKPPEYVEYIRKRMLGTQLHLRVDISTEEIGICYESGESSREIAKQLGVDKSLVLRRLRKSGIKARRNTNQYTKTQGDSEWKT
jgi:hypothetical protein